MASKRGRKSTGDLTALAITGPVFQSRLDVPDHLTPAQEAVFRAVVDALPARFFSPEQSELVGGICPACRHSPYAFC